MIQYVDKKVKFLVRQSPKQPTTGGAINVIFMQSEQVDPFKCLDIRKYFCLSQQDLPLFKLNTQYPLHV